MKNAERKAMALMLRLIAQVLVKLHAGKAFGETERGVMELTRQAYEVAEAIVSPVVKTPPQAHDKALGEIERTWGEVVLEHFSGSTNASALAHGDAIAAARERVGED